MQSHEFTENIGQYTARGENYVLAERHMKDPLGIGSTDIYITYLPTTDFLGLNIAFSHSGIIGSRGALLAAANAAVNAAWSEAYSLYNAVKAADAELEGDDSEGNA